MPNIDVAQVLEYAERIQGIYERAPNVDIARLLLTLENKCSGILTGNETMAEIKYTSDVNLAQILTGGSSSSTTNAEAAVNVDIIARLTAEEGIYERASNVDATQLPGIGSARLIAEEGIYERVPNVDISQLSGIAANSTIVQ